QSYQLDNPVAIVPPIPVILCHPFRESLCHFSGQNSGGHCATYIEMFKYFVFKTKMAGKRLDIMDLKQLISFKNKGFSNRKVASALGVSRNTVNNYVRLFESHHLNYKELLKLDEQSLQELFPSHSEIDSYRYKQL